MGISDVAWNAFLVVTHASLLISMCTNIVGKSFRNQLCHIWRNNSWTLSVWFDDSKDLESTEYKLKQSSWDKTVCVLKWGKLLFKPENDVKTWKVDNKVLFPKRKPLLGHLSENGYDFKCQAKVQMLEIPCKAFDIRVGWVNNLFSLCSPSFVRKVHYLQHLRGYLSSMK